MQIKQRLMHTALRIAADARYTQDIRDAAARKAEQYRTELVRDGIIPDDSQVAR